MPSWVSAGASEVLLELLLVALVSPIFRHDWFPLDQLTVELHAS